MIIKPYGNDALIVKLDGGINEQNLTVIQSIVIHLNSVYAEGIIDLIPAYDSLVVSYNRQVITYNHLAQSITDTKLSNTTHQPKRELVMPICFDDEFALDRERLEDYLNISFSQLVQTFISESYDVYMMGFLPGFAYMASVPSSLRCPRLPNPRKSISAGSLAITGEQTAIYPSDSPGGWNIIGHCPLDLFDIRRENWSLLKAHDRVRFRLVERVEHDEIAYKVQNGSFNYGQIMVDEL